MCLLWLIIAQRRFATIITIKADHRLQSSRPSITVISTTDYGKSQKVVAFVS